MRARRPGRGLAKMKAAMSSAFWRGRLTRSFGASHRTPPFTSKAGLQLFYDVENMIGSADGVLNCRDCPYGRFIEAEVTLKVISAA
jgi:hypothetical protein